MFTSHLVNQAIELHDSELAEVIVGPGEVTFTLQPAYVHSSSGVPGVDAGTGWLQAAVLALRGGTLFSQPTSLPATIAHGFLRVDARQHNNTIPIGSFEGYLELSFVLVTGETVTARGLLIDVSLQGEATFVENFGGDCC